MKLNLSYKCKECGADFKTHVGLVYHIVNDHAIQVKEYYEKYIKSEDEGKCALCGKPTYFLDLRKGYRKFCSRTCNNKYNHQNPTEEKLTCAICGFTIVGKSKANLTNKLKKHLETHNTTIKEYYDKYMRKPGEGFCQCCGKPTTFKNIFVGYLRCCSGLCAAQKSKAEKLLDEKQYQEQLNQIKEEKENKLNDYIQELKNREHEFDWKGERNTWAGGVRTKRPDDENNILTNNTMTYIDGQEYNSDCQTITINEEQSIDDVFWL